MNKSVAILGGGLSAAYCYLACKRHGEIEPIDIYADRLDQLPRGPIVLRWYPRDEAPADVKLEPYTLIGMGSREYYMARIDRPRWDTKTTFPETGISTGLVMRPSVGIEIAFRGVQPKSWDGDKTKFNTQEIGEIAKAYDVVFQTFPTEKAIEQQPKMREYFMLEKEAESGSPNFCIYNGANFYNWTRYTSLFGYLYWEYSHKEFPSPDKIPDMPEGASIIKLKDFAPGTLIVGENETDFENVFLLGRYATWNKSYLSHDAYWTTQKILSQLF